MKPAVIALLLSASVVQAQVQNDTFAFCDGNTETIYEIIGQGKPLIIASLAFTSQPSRAAAQRMKPFSDDNPAIRIIGAMNHQSDELPSCSYSNFWSSEFKWIAIPQFVDSSDEWKGPVFPTFYVISPVDSQLVYEGNSFAFAALAAQSFLPTGVNEVDSNSPVFYYDAATHSVRFNFVDNAERAKFSLMNVTGEVVLESASSESVMLPGDIAAGVYFGVVRAKGKVYTRKVLVR